MLLGVLLIGYTWSNVLFNRQSGEFTSALAAKDAPRFWRAILWYSALLVAAVPINAYYYYVRDTLGIEWRRWVTDQMLAGYFNDRAYYRLLSNHDIDNPDQRISEDIYVVHAAIAELSTDIPERGLRADRIQRRVVVHFEISGGIRSGLCGRRNVGHGGRFRQQDDRLVFSKIQTRGGFSLRAGAHSRKRGIHCAVQRRGKRAGATETTVPRDFFEFHGHYQLGIEAEPVHVHVLVRDDRRCRASFWRRACCRGNWKWAAW